MIAAERLTRKRTREQVAGQPVDPVGKAEATRAVVTAALSGTSGNYVCLTNAHTAVESNDVPQLRAAAKGAFLSVPDGMPLVWVLRRRGHKNVEKITGIEFMPQVAAAGLSHGLRHFFYGGAPEVADGAARGLQRLVPGTDVVGTISPPYATLEDWPLDDLKAAIERTRPHILWVGLGAPKQEMWMHQMAGQLEVPVMLGVGAGFDFLAGAKKACPPYLRHIGLEWLYRLASEPRRLWKRYLVGNSRFVYQLVKQRSK